VSTYLTTDIDNHSRAIGPPDLGADEAIPVLTVAKAGPAEADPGASITYTLYITNTGFGTANNVVLTDALPSGAGFVRASDGGLLSSGVVTWPTFAVSSNGGVVVRTFAVTATETITNAAYRATAQGVQGVAGTGEVVTTIGEYRIYLPLVLRNHG
jgi:uncharacterized repeat protein (TIGR01451 family)